LPKTFTKLFSLTKLCKLQNKQIARRISALKKKEGNNVNKQEDKSNNKELTGKEEVSNNIGIQNTERNMQEVNGGIHKQIIPTQTQTYNKQKRIKLKIINKLNTIPIKPDTSQRLNPINAHRTSESVILPILFLDKEDNKEANITPTPKATPARPIRGTEHATYFNPSIIKQ
jgi:hypothetical protein